ncbi:MAG: dephospho-CoA kinase [Paludibacteraceae bacterium]|nr:dephospho-CoA kinase [Paludibacteraceae bacterium]
MIIGITGGIGSGKSTVARVLAKRGYTVYDCDREAKRIIAENPKVQQKIIALLGEEAFVNGQYNTAYVAKRVFANPDLLEGLNNIVHPEVALDILAQKPDFIESAILYESGMNALCEKIVVVDAPEEIRIARTIARDYHGEATPENINKVRARIYAQGEYDIQTLLPVLHLNNDGSVPVEAMADDVIRFVQGLNL